jgi:CRISPR-associated endoribonuclease Cas6
MSLQYLYSVILEIRAHTDSLLPATTGHQAHALFLDLVHQVDPDLFAHLHDDPHYRPFTVSALSGAQERNTTLFLQAGQIYRLRFTFLDGGPLWNCLSNHFLAVREMKVHLGSADFTLQRVLSTPPSDATGWAGYIGWQTLAITQPCNSITIQFASPTAFSLGERNFSLFPEPILVWDSLMRTWNLYAPGVLQIEKQAMREFVKAHVVISDYNLHTTMLHFPKYKQKGFIGTCTYTVKKSGEYATHLAALAEFARYAGIGYKTTMGMGQVRLEHCQKA